MESGAAYDVLIIGGGQAGIPLVHRLASEGMSVALAERKDLGGSCVNFGCTPTKAAIASAKVAHQARRAAEYGLRIPEVRVDFPAVLERARGIVELKRNGLNKGFEDAENPELIRGDRKSTRLNSSHANISYAVFCLKKKTQQHEKHIVIHRE